MKIAKAEVALRGKDETAAAFRSVIRNAEAAQKSITSKFRGAFAFLGAGTAIFGIQRAITSAIRAGDDLAKFAEKSGLAAEAASELAHAAKMADLDLGQLATGVRFMQKNISEAASGSKSAQATFRALGLEWQELKRLAPDQQLEQIAEQLSRLEDPADRARAATELFGRAGADLLPLFSQGAQGIREARQEAQELGKSFSAEDLQRFQDADDAMKRLAASTSAMADQVALKLSPSLVNVMTLLRQIFGGTTKEEELQLKLDLAWRGVQSFGKMINESPEGIRALENYAAALNEMADFRIERLLERTKGMGMPAPRPPGFEATGEDPEKAEEKIRQVIAAVEQQVATYKEGEAAALSYRIAHGDLAKALEAVGEKAGPLRARLKELAGDLAAAMKAAESKKAREEIQGLIDKIDEEIATFGRGEVAALRYRTEHGKLGEQFRLVGDDAAALREELIRNQQTLEALQDSQRILSDRTTRAKEIFESTRTPFEKMKADILEVQRLAHEGFLDPDTEKRRIKLVVDEYEKATTKISEYWLEAQRGIQRSLANFLKDPSGSGGFRGFFKSLVDTIHDAWANALSANILDMIGLGPNGPKKGGALASIFSTATMTPTQGQKPVEMAVKTAAGVITGDPCHCVTQAGTAVATAMQDAEAGVATAIQGGGRGLMQSIWDGLKAGGGWLTNALRGIFGWFANLISGMGGGGASSGLFGAISNFLPSLISGNGGGWSGQGIGQSVMSGFGGSFGGFFARGGDLAPGEWGWAGEDGPEPVVGGRYGKTIIPMSAMRGGGTAENHVDARTTIYVDARYTKKDAAEELIRQLPEVMDRRDRALEAHIVTGLRRHRYATA